MPSVICKVCSQEFHIKPSHLKLGWGKYCSRNCQAQAQFNGKLVKCFICSKDIYRSKVNLKRSSSGKYFCNKSCQTLWRNQIYIEENSANWKTGINAYRDILKRSNKKVICSFCKTKDERVLIVHHINHNREDNKLKNLIWLCCNCHFLVHHYKEVEEKLLKSQILET